MVAILYRPAKRKSLRNDPDFNGDMRQRFNSHTVAFRLHQVRQLPLATKLAVLYFFAGCKAHFASSFSGLFTRSENKSANGTWLHVLDAFTDHISQYSEVLDMPANLVLFSMEETRKQNERLLAQYA